MGNSLKFKLEEDFEVRNFKYFVKDCQTYGPLAYSIQIFHILA
jgi:hypothetical protein